MEKILKSITALIFLSFAALFFLVPLVLTDKNYELFEYNKMMVTYAITVVVCALWSARMILSQKLLWKKTPLDIPILLFLLSQLASFIFSIDRHVSWWGYYSRFHGGLLSTISYVVLYYAFVSNLTNFKLQIANVKLNPIIIIVSLITGFIVSIYGIFEHFGHSPSCLLFTGNFDVACWVQDVQNRVYATLGQPNWMAAYLAILIPISLAMGIMENGKKSLSLRSILYFLFSIFFYIALLYTKSRSGFLGLWVSLVIFTIILLTRFQKRVVKELVIVIGLFLIITFISGSPFEQINHYFSLGSIQTHLNPSQLIANSQQPIPAPAPALETGGTESGEIRKIVWKGALDIARAYPLFGSGVETFAFSYYQYRPVQHNMTSEWDFLYNKAHNEYLNYLATTGIFGLGSYLLFIGWFIVWMIKQISPPYLTSHLPLLISLLCGWLSILITNFFGFSVVPVAIFFWLIPAIAISLAADSSPSADSPESAKESSEKTNAMSMGSAPGLPIAAIWIGALVIVAVFSVMMLLKLTSLWLADADFAKAYNATRTNQHAAAYESFQSAILLNSTEPLYHDEFASTLATLALAAHDQNDATLSGALQVQAKHESDYAVQSSPNNINFWKTRTRVFYTLSEIDPRYNAGALEAITRAKSLSPTDAKITYNLGLIYERLGQRDQALDSFKESIRLKPNYREPRYALGLFYHEMGQPDEAISEMNYILANISPKDEEVTKKLEEWKKNPPVRP